MARPKEFERETALQEAIKVFSEHGYEGTSTEALLEIMGSVARVCTTHSATNCGCIWKRFNATRRTASAISFASSMQRLPQ
jgi:hypothetical protein